MEEKQEESQLESKDETKEQAAAYWKLPIETDWYDIYGSASIFLK